MSRTVRSLTSATLALLALTSCRDRSYNVSDTQHFANANLGAGAAVSMDFSELAAAAGLPANAFKAAKRNIKDLPDDVEESLRFNWEVKVNLQTQAQFDALRKAVAGWSKVQSPIAFRGAGEYALEEFLPPAIQATYAKRFEPNLQRDFYFTADDAKRAPAGAALPEMMVFMTNCWTTVYGVMYSSLATDPGAQATFPAFMINSDIVRVLGNDQYFTKVSSAKAPQAAQAERSLVAGDVLLVFGAGAVTNGQRSILHAALKISDDLWYEKTANTGDVAYRLVSFADIVKKYSSYEGADFEFRRPTGKALPHPSKVFGMSAMYGEPGVEYPQIFSRFVSESPYPTPPRGAEGFAIRDITLVAGDANRKAALPANAFDPATFTLPGQASRPIEFRDLVADAYGGENPYATEIREAAIRGLVNGTEPGVFHPAGDVNRAQAATMAINLLGKLPGNLVTLPAAGTSAFPDVPATHWAATRIAFAKANGIVGGKPDGTFAPDAPVSRAELAIIFKNAAQFARKKRNRPEALPVLAPSDFSRFSDLEGHWAKDTVQSMANYCASASVSMSGRDTMLGLFRPNNPASRSYAAASLLRLYHCISRER